MSTTLSTQDMVAEVKVRFPIGLTSTFVINRLNWAFRWIEQRGNFTWMLRKATVTITTGEFPFPTSPAGSVCDMGRPHWALSAANLPMKYVRLEELTTNATYQLAAITTMPSAYASYVDGSGNSIGIVAPTVTGTTATLYYHRQTPAPLVEAPGVYFPTPDCFDNTIVVMAESEARRIYACVGWDVALKDAEDEALRMMETYRTTAVKREGLQELAKQAQETDLKRAEA